MIPVRSLLSQVAPVARNNLLSNQRRMIISGPPAVRVSFGEKLAHMLFIGVGVMVVPFYILVNVKHYKGRS